MAGKTLRGRMDAVVCYNDQTAQLVIRALQEEGLRIAIVVRVGTALDTIFTPRNKFDLEQISFMKNSLLV